MRKKLLDTVLAASLEKVNYTATDANFINLLNEIYTDYTGIYRDKTLSFSNPNKKDAQEISFSIEVLYKHLDKIKSPREVVKEFIVKNIIRSIQIWCLYRIDEPIPGFFYDAAVHLYLNFDPNKFLGNIITTRDTIETDIDVALTTAVIFNPKVPQNLVIIKEEDFRLLQLCGHEDSGTGHINFNDIHNFFLNLGFRA